MQPSHTHISTLAAVVVGNCVGAFCRGDIGLDHHQVRLVVQLERLHVLIHHGDLVLRIEIPCQGCQA